MEHMPLEQAVALLTREVTPVGEECLFLAELPLGRILAQSVVAEIDQPPFSRSPLDGYAFYAADTVGTDKYNPLTLPVNAIIRAGDFPAKWPMERGCGVNVMTGAVIPPGCDCVVAQEHTSERDGGVTIFAALKPGENYIAQGEEFCKGDLLLRRGDLLSPAALGVAAGAGVEQLTVFLRPRVALVATGDELTPLGRPLKPGKIYNSSLIYLQSRLIQLGCEVVEAVQVRDEVEAIAQAVRRGAERADVVFTTGGVSVGRWDLLPQAMAALGAEEIFHGVAMKPGASTLFSRLEGTPILSLSGNPFAAAATLEVLARPLVAALAGGGEMRWVTVPLGQIFPKASPIPRFVRGRYEGGELTLSEGNSSGQLLSMVGCNCLARLPAGGKAVPVGEKISILLL